MRALSPRLEFIVPNFTVRCSSRVLDLLFSLSHSLAGGQRAGGDWEGRVTGGGYSVLDHM